MPDDQPEIEPDDQPKRSFQGDRFKVVHCLGARESFEISLGHCEKGRANALRRGMDQQIKRLADGHRMSDNSFPSEGKLPKVKGQSKQKKFNAFKRLPIRGYCWFSEKHTDTYFISHYIFKNFDKLSNKDTGKVGANWTRIEVDGDEF